MSCDDNLCGPLKALAAQYPQYSYLMLQSLLRREGIVINKKRTYRIYCNGAHKETKASPAPHQPTML
ncbi:hypothetical protein DWB84_18060 [Saccharophagus sp. K07]|nr:hypothetical protein [Saccharophagus sp. K07]